MAHESNSVSQPLLAGRLAGGEVFGFKTPAGSFQVGDEVEGIFASTNPGCLAAISEWNLDFALESSGGGSFQEFWVIRVLETAPAAPYKVEHRDSTDTDEVFVVRGVIEQVFRQVPEGHARAEAFYRRALGLA